MARTFSLGQDYLTYDVLGWLSQSAAPALILNEKIKSRIDLFREEVERKAKGDISVYGINTGFGFLSNVKIDKSQLRDLQVNIIRSHACGVGDYLSDQQIRAMLILRAHTFAFGHSGVSLDLIEHLLQFIKFDILPLVPSQGSVGASGDLAPLAHIALALIGEGKCRNHGNAFASSDLLRKHNLQPYIPKAKEGLSLINGTHFMTALAAINLVVAQNLLRSADVLCALSLDGIRGSLVPFDERIHALRPHPGQAVVSQNLRMLFSKGDEVHESHRNCGKVQDPYSFRCVPQVHGATRDCFQFVKDVINRELNSVTDNPLVFADGDILSGGNFHGQPIAMAMDFLAIAMAEIGSISERRIEKLTNPQSSGLPAFAVNEGGLNSGFMIPHVVAASLVSENKILCHPASVDSIPTSADKEDHVSMGACAVVKAQKVLDNLTHILAVELLISCQSIDLLRPMQLGEPLALVFKKVREKSPFMSPDRCLHEDIKELANWLKEGELLTTLAAGGFEIA